jgi:hypothetical protein
LDESAHFRIVTKISTKQHVRTTGSQLGDLDQEVLTLLEGRTTPVSTLELAASLADRLNQRFTVREERYNFRHNLGKRLHALNRRGLVAAHKKGRRMFWTVVSSGLLNPDLS